MSHDEHSHDTHAVETKPKGQLGQAFWFVLILALLFIAALNFANVMGADEGEHGGHEAHAEATHGIATEHEGKHATEHSEDPATEVATEHAPVTDSAAHSEAH